MLTAVLAWKYKSALTLMEALFALQLSAPDCGWRIHESEATGRYVMGECHGMKVKIFQEEGEIEAWYPPTPPPTPEEVSTRVQNDVLPVIEATEVKRVP